MLFRQLFDAGSSTYTYLLAADNAHEAIIIDPVYEKLTFYLNLLSELNLQLKIAIDTHMHADHVTATGLLRQHTGCEIAMGKQTKAQGIDRLFDDNDVITVKGLELKALYTPGHTDDSYCLLLPDRVFTGDTLLIRSTGRVDFLNGDSYQHYTSLFQKLLTLPPATLVYPAHNYHGMTVSTIAEEQRCNPHLQVSSADEYAKIMRKPNLPLPKMIDIAVPANQKCGVDYKA